MDAIRKTSGHLRLFLIFLLFSLPFIFLYTHLLNSAPSFNFSTIKGPLILPLDAQSQQILTVLNILPLSIQMYITFCLIMILDYCKQGKLFAEDATLYLRRIGISLLCYTVVQPLTQFGMSLTLREYTQGHIFLTVNSAQIILAIAGIVVIIFALILQEANKMKQEHDTFF